MAADSGKHNPLYGATAGEYREAMNNARQIIAEAKAKGWVPEPQKSQEELQRKWKRKQIAYFRSMEYQRYLQTPHWKETRMAALRAAHFRCYICGRDKELNIHHRTYAHLGDERSEDLGVFCRACHKKVHEWLSQEDEDLA